MKKIAIYGKGGIGKSTTTANISAALANRGLKVMQIGCDPKSDSTNLLMHGEQCPTVLDLIRANNEDITLEDVIHVGYKGILCVETGGPTPGIGCAGRGIITAFDLLERLNAYDVYKPDVVLYDVLGDVVCGGFAMPLRGKYADSVYIVTSGEKMALFAANNIAAAVHNFETRNYARLGGLILNSRNVPDEYERVKAVADKIGTEIAAVVPRSDYITLAEDKNMTAVEGFPGSDIAAVYGKLADKLIAGNEAENG